MNTVLWIVQILLALAFLATGLLKLTQPYEKLGAQMGWVKEFSPSNVRLIGLAEVLGAAGLILPRLLGILPWLTPLAAAGLVIIMIGAIVTHARRHETPLIIVNVVLLLLAAFVVYGRFFAAA